MGYQQLSRMEIVEVVRRWQVGESQRAIARASGVARETVKKYLRAAEELGLAANGPPPTEDQVVRLVQVGRVVSAPRTWASPQADRLDPYREQITATEMVAIEFEVNPGYVHELRTAMFRNSV